jgi:hypothetical protein
MAKDAAPGVSFHDFSAGGQTGGPIREKDWAATPLGPKDSWPGNLTNYLSSSVTSDGQSGSARCSATIDRAPI